MKLKYYVVVTHDGTVKSKTLIASYKRACYWAKDEGDTVVAVDVDLEVEPVFIRKRTL